jgi:hypothetical protein
LKNRKLLLILDEFTDVESWPDPAQARNLIRDLKLLAEARTLATFLICVHETLYRADNRQGALSGPLLRYGAPLHLPHLDEVAARSLINSPMGDLLHYDAGVPDSILQLTACQPYYLQTILGLIVDHARGLAEQNSTAIHVTRQVLSSVLQEFLGSEEAAARFYDYERLASATHERAGMKVLWALAQLAAVTTPDPLAKAESMSQRKISLHELISTLQHNFKSGSYRETEDVLTYLSHVGAVSVSASTDDPRYYFSVPLFGLYVCQRHTLRSVREQSQSAYQL